MTVGYITVYNICMQCERQLLLISGDVNVAIFSTYFDMLYKDMRAPVWRVVMATSTKLTV